MGTSRHTRGLALAAVFLLACGGPAPTPGIDAAASDTGGPGLDGGGGGDPFIVRVVHSDRAPIAGAVVALDRPGGLRIEATTGAVGLATFDIDWANGPFDVVAWAPGNGARANLDVDRVTYERYLIEGQWWMFLDALEPPSTITVSGALTNIAAPLDNVYVFATAGGDNWVGRNGPFDLEVPSSTPFRLRRSRGAAKARPAAGRSGVDESSPHAVRLRSAAPPARAPRKSRRVAIPPTV